MQDTPSGLGSEQSLVATTIPNFGYSRVHGVGGNIKRLGIIYEYVQF